MPVARVAGVTASEFSLKPDRDRGSGFLLQVGQADQSYVDLDDPEWLEFDYIQRMVDVLEASEPTRRPIRVIHVGGAGMTLARYVAATRPRSPQIVLEPDEALTAYVREHLPLPPRSGIKVRGVDGRAGLAAMREDYADVIILDAFVGARVPADLTTREFLAQAASVLVGGGLLMINLTDRAPFDYLRRVLSGVRESFAFGLLSAEPATFKGRRFGNVLVCASNSDLPAAALERKAARSAFPYRVISGEGVARAFAPAKPFVAADCSMSPEPPGGKGFFS